MIRFVPLARRLERSCNNVMKARTALHESLEGLSLEKAVLTSKLQGLATVEGKATCPTCLQLVSRRHLEMHVTELQKQYASCQKKLALLRKSDEQLQERLTGLEDQIKAIEKVSQDYTEHAQDAQDDVAQCIGELETAKTWWRQERERRAKLERRLRDHRRNLKFWSRQVDILTEEKAVLEYCSTAFSRNGVPAFLNAQVCPVLNRSAEFYSDVFTGKEIQIRFAMKDAEFDVQVINAHGGGTIYDQSTGERKMASIIAAFALRDIAQPCNLLILDEPGDGLDAVNAKSFAAGLRKIKERLGTVLLTSHNPVIIGELSGENTITIEKQGGISRVT
jgi:DNA repair exonuclease SbcCD ATPase subunit